MEWTNVTDEGFALAYPQPPNSSKRKVSYNSRREPEYVGYRLLNELSYIQSFARIFYAPSPKPLDAAQNSAILFNTG